MFWHQNEYTEKCIIHASINVEAKLLINTYKIAFLIQTYISSARDDGFELKHYLYQER